MVYSIAGVRLGVLNFCFVAACACWVVYLGSLLFGLRLDRPAIAGTLFGLAIVTSIYGIIDARWVRVKRVYTSSGAGTWGPPMRVGTRPEIALIEFE
jgi:hypothetical protein